MADKKKEEEKPKEEEKGASFMETKFKGMPILVKKETAKR
mgnify:CR=1 FL=1